MPTQGSSESGGVTGHSAESGSLVDTGTPPRSGARHVSSQVKQELGQEYRTLKMFSQMPHRVHESILSVGNMVELNLQSSVMK